MKKRLLSLLMAVLMLVSLVPAVYADGDTTDCKHDDVTVISVKKDADKKTPGVEAKICNDCGWVDGLEITRFSTLNLTCKHEKTATMVAKEATCDEYGLIVCYCTACGKSQKSLEFGNDTYQRVDPVGHSFVDFTVVQKPTCTVDGWGYAICKVCGAVEKVMNAEEAAAKVDVSAYATTAQQNAAVQAVYDKFIKTNPNHADTSKFVTVTKETKIVGENNVEVTLYPASTAKHEPTVNGQTFTKNPDGTYTQADAEDVYDYSGDKICPDCGKEYVKGEKTVHSWSVVDDGNGMLPYVDDAGKSQNGKTDKITCNKCKETGGDTIRYTAKPTSWYANDAVEATCTADGKEATYYWIDKDGVTHHNDGKVIPALGHDWVSWDPKPAGCEEGETGTIYLACTKCSRCGFDNPANDESKTVPIPVTGHKDVTTVVAEASCTNDGLSYTQCSACGDYKDTSDPENPKYYDVEVPIINTTKGGNHVAADTLKDAKDATCKEVGYTGDKVCKFCGEVLEKGEEIKVLEHKTELKDAKDATCAAAGYTGDEVCTVCGEVVKKGTEIAKGQHKTELKNVKDATCTAAGYSGDEVCTVCGETVKKGEETALAAHKFANGVCTVCGAKDTTVNPFKDVNKDTHKCYYDAILWGYYNGVVKGTNDAQTLFSPDATCTRAQIVTFLYRAEKASPVTGVANPFTDVSATADKDYYDAIMWAVKNGIVEGTSATTFDPYATCTRAQIVTMLYRLEGKPAVTNKTVFTDLTDDWYISAVNWAFNLGIAQGTGNGAFSPDEPCTRAQTITFIYRYYNT